MSTTAVVCVLGVILIHVTLYLALFVAPGSYADDRRARREQRP